MMDFRASDPVAERAVLAACLMSKTARQEARRHIVTDDFDDLRHRRIWEGMQRLDRHGKTVDPVTMLAVLQGERGPLELMPELVTAVAVPDNVGEHAEIVRGWAIKRRIKDEAADVLANALNPSLQAVGFAARVATRFASIRDAGIPDTTTAETLGELLAEPDDEPDWLIPNLLERRDRFMLTGEEGLGKSHLLRQIAVMAAAGLHPFETTRMQPLKVCIIDCENSRQQVKRKIRAQYDFAARHGMDPQGRVVVECSSRIDITRDKDLAEIHNLLDAQIPDLVVIGPLYRLVPRALQTDDEAAPVLAALDTIRDRGIALLMEAHAGHAVGKGGTRDLRPRGSSALLGWPEFGYGMRNESRSFAKLVPWRGDREERNWPDMMRRADDGARWIPTEAFPYEQGWTA